MIDFKKLDLWAKIAKIGDPYPLVRPFLFMMDPEDAHILTMKMLGYDLGPQFHGPDDPILKTEAFGVEFPNPIGLAAGLDKQATRMDAFMGFGFGHIEVGTIVPLPQPGNPRPRMFRASGAKALINRFGFNSDGVEVFAQRMKDWRAKEDRTKNPIGINIGKNKDTQDDAVDYVKCFEKVWPYADYITVNVSCPNMTGVCDLQGRDRMADLLKRVTDARDKVKPELPVLVKISPDLDDAAIEDVASVVKESKVQGVIIANTTVARPSTIPDNVAEEAGGLSGPCLFGPSTRMLSKFYKLTEGKVPLIGCGGVSTGKEAYQKIRAGASLVQIYTALVFEGPLVVEKIKEDLANFIRRDGYKSVAQVVGIDCK